VQQYDRYRGIVPCDSFNAGFRVGINLTLSRVQIRHPVAATMVSHVRSVYGRHSTADEPLDYVQQSVRLSSSFRSFSLCDTVRSLLRQPR